LSDEWAVCPNEGQVFTNPIAPLPICLQGKTWLKAPSWLMWGWMAKVAKDY
jgi:hypothetical protein